MDHLLIPIPEGLAASRKEELTRWLSVLANQVAGCETSPDDDPAIRNEAIERIRVDLSEIEAGRGVDGHEAMCRIAERHGLSVLR